MADTASDEWIAYYMPRAEAGEPDAQLNVGLAYATGKYLEKDIEEAEKWFRRAAQSLGDVGYFHIIKTLIIDDSPRVMAVFSEKEEWGHPSIYLLVGEHLLRLGEKKKGLDILKTRAERGSVSAQLSHLKYRYDGIFRTITLPWAIPLLFKEVKIRVGDKNDPRIRR